VIAVSTLTLPADFLRGATFVFGATTPSSRRLLRRLAAFDLVWRVNRTDARPAAGIVVDLDLDDDRAVALAEALGELAGRSWREGRSQP
jgi:hypothetical protein